MSNDRHEHGEPWRDPERYPSGGQCHDCGTVKHGKGKGPKSPWGYWCLDHNIARMERIGRSFEGLGRVLTRLRDRERQQ